MLKILFRHYY